MQSYDFLVNFVVMRYLIVHNRYSKIGGEESVVAQQEQLLRSAGHDVMLYQRSYDEINSWRLGRLTSFFSSLYNRRSVKDVKRIIAEFKPDVAIVHNLFPVISPAILPILNQRGVRILMTVHNFRLICPTGLFFRDGRICEKCGEGVREFNCFANRCQGTVAGSFSFAFRSYWARVTKKYTKNIDRFLVLSEFQRDKLVEYGLSGNKMSVVPNFYQPPALLENIDVDSDGYVGFVGRLSVEKGVGFLFEIASNMPDVEFRVAGTFAEGYSLGDIPSNVKMCGFLSKEELVEFYKRAGVIISTSLCYEGFPISILEAMYFGRAVLVPNTSVFPVIVDNGQCGILYQIGNLSDALYKLCKLLKNSELRNAIGELAHKKIVDVYNSDNYLNAIISISYKK